MSEERVIRINKVLRELNISLERAVDYLKDKGIAIDANPNAKISDSEFNILQSQFAGDKGNKEASKEVGEEKRKEKEALRVEREKEIEDKRRQDEERQKQQEVIKAKAVVTGPVQVGKIDLNPRKPEKPAVVAAPAEEPVKAEEPKVVVATPAQEEKPVQKEAVLPEPVAPVLAEDKVEKPIITEKKEVKAETPKVAQEPVVSTDPATAEETITTQYQKLSGTTLTGQTIDLSQFNKPKKKKEDPKITPNKPGAPGTGNNANKNKRKRIAPKPGTPGAPKPATGNAPGTPNPNKITPNTGGGGFNANRSARPGFVKGNRPAIVAKVEPTEEEVKNQIRETLEKLQGKGGKSKAAKYRRDKRDTHRQKSDEEQRAIDEGSRYCW
jgi:translation initiation factor IF-2